MRTVMGILSSGLLLVTLGVAVPVQWAVSDGISEFETETVGGPLKYLGSSLWADTRDIAVVDTLAFWVMSPGLRIMNVSSGDPQVVSRLWVSEVCKSISVSNHLGALVTDSGLIVIDVSHAAKPTILGRYRSIEPVIDVALDHHTAYLCYEKRADIIDLTDPSSPTYVTSFGDGSRLWEVYVRHSIVFLGSGPYIEVYDVSSKQSATLISRISVSAWAAKFDIEGNLLYVGCGIVYEPSGSSSLEVYDISDLQFPRAVSSYSFWGSMSDISVANERAYIAADRDGLVVFDVSQPSNPFIESCVEAPGKIETCATTRDGVLVTQAITPPLLTGYQGYDVCASDVENRPVNASIPSDPDSSSMLLLEALNGDSLSVIGHYHPEVRSLRVDLHDRYAIALGEAGRLALVDLRAPRSMEELGSIQLPEISREPGQVRAVGDLVYVCSGMGGLFIVDVSEPSRPRVATVYETQGSCYDIVLLGKYAYVADGPNGLVVLDLSDLRNPVEVSRVSVPDWALLVELVGTHLFVGARFGGLGCFDVSDPAVPKLVSSYPSAGEGTLINSMAFVGHYGYLSGGGSDIRIVDFSDLSSPRLVDSVGLPSLVRALACGGGYLVAALGDGVEVFDISVEAKPVAVSWIESLGFSSDVSIDGHLVAVADYTSLIEYALVCSSTDSGYGCAPGSYHLFQNYPNPFNSATSIEYSLTVPAFVKLNILNCIGQKVVTLVEGIKTSGKYYVSWDGRNTSGQEVASGVYFYRLETNDWQMSKKMILMR